MTNEERRPSLKEFDYFDESREAVGWDGGPAHAEVQSSLEGRLAEYRARQRRYSRSVILMTVTFGVCAWFMSGFRDEIAYAFRSPERPREMGAVTDFAPQDLQANTFVQLRGITEPFRGLQQKRTRGLGFDRREYWYFRLAGSGGVFIETPADPETYGYATEVSVSGRVVDPEHDPDYHALLDHYHARYFTKRQPVSRIVQVGVVPGEGRTPYLIAFAVLAALLLSNGYALLRLMQYRRLAAGAR